METNEFSGITTLAQLRSACKKLSGEIADHEALMLSRLDNFRSALSLKLLLLTAIRKFRKKLLGTPFAKY